MRGSDNEDSIRSLDWKEHIRLRPGMYIGKLGDGSSQDDGIYVLLKEVMDNCIDEHMMGYGKHIELVLNSREVTMLRNIGRGAGRMAPIGAWDVLPPLPRIIALGQFVWHFKNHGTGLAHGLWQASVVLGIDGSFSHGDIRRGFDKGFKFLVSDFGAVHPKAFDFDIAHRLFFGVNRVAHVELATWHPDHAWMG